GAVLPGAWGLLALHPAAAAPRSPLRGGGTSCGRALATAAVARKSRGMVAGFLADRRFHALPYAFPAPARPAGYAAARGGPLVGERAAPAPRGAGGVRGGPCGAGPRHRARGGGRAGGRAGGALPGARPSLPGR